MKVLYRQLEVELRLFLRNKQEVFFTALFPLLMMSLFGYLNREASVGDVSYVAFLLPGIIGMSVMAAAFLNMSTTLVRQRDDGILKRLRGTPLQAWALLGAKVLAAGTVILFQVLLLTGVGVLFFGVEVAGSVPWFLATLLVGTFAFTAMGLALASLINNADTASAAAHAIYLPMLFICGPFFPVDVMPRLLQHVASVLPLTYFLNLTSGATIILVAGAAYLLSLAVKSLVRSAHASLSETM
ncbi:MAG: ABC transporter permease [Anaerolineae bacterium]|nr:ABC transporter permease [Anaerolineae bacterium]